MEFVLCIIGESEVDSLQGVRRLFPLKKIRAQTGVCLLEENVVG